MLKFIKEKLYYHTFIESKSFKDRLLSNELLSNSLLKFLLLIALLTNIFGLCFPILGSNDSNFYAVVAKEMINSGNWINLTFAHQDWLDKPHFPFWLTAISFKIFGINTFAYVLPGFIFNLIGVRYTYLLAKHFYNHQVGLVASIIYLSALHLMLSAIDVRAEAFLLGSIIPACYYWLLYQEQGPISLQLLFKGAIFTAIAIMSKGIFVLLPIFSGLICLLLFNRNTLQFLKQKFPLAILLITFFILPEIISLYLQFDLHPEKLIYGHTDVSGIKFFFWDSQFGRFFDTGPIVSGHHGYDVMHYFYFLHTFLWAFLPWSMIAIVAMWNIFKDFSFSSELPKVAENKSTHIYLIGSIIPTFVLFSLTKFQLDHYTNILFPFVSIICAAWICNKATRVVTHPVFYFQIFLSYIICGIVLILALLLFNDKMFIFMVGLAIICIALFAIFNNNRGLNKAIVYSVFSICLSFILLMLIGGRLYLRYDAGYNIDQVINQQAPATLIDYNVNYSSLEFHSDDPYLRINNESQLLTFTPPYYLVTDLDQWNQLESKLKNSKKISVFPWIPQSKYIGTLFSLAQRNKYTQQLALIYVAKPILNSRKAVEVKAKKITVNDENDDESDNDLQ
jgi:4-amino-4-deoxy-L-arabinose transferase-like glycosyltransferase